MRENETDKSRDLITPDDERQYDYCSKSMMDLIMIIIRRYGGAISSQTLYQLLDRSDYENKNCHSKILLKTLMSMAKLRARNEIKTHRIAI